MKVFAKFHSIIYAVPAIIISSFVSFLLYPNDLALAAKGDYRQAIVKIERKVGGGSPAEIGTGFFVSSDGHIITAAHILKNSDESDEKIAKYPIKIFEFGKTLPKDARILAMNRLLDIALLKVKVESNVPFLTYGDSNLVEIGNNLTVIGHPLRMGAGPSEWQPLSTSIQTINSKERITISSDLFPGHSGAPAIDAAGKVIGICSYNNPTDNESYLVPINEAKLIFNVSTVNKIITPREKNLIINNDPSKMHQAVTISFEHLTLYNIKGHSVVKTIKTVKPLNIDISVTGPGGIDKGVERNNTWYYIWLIFDPKNNSIAGIFSLSHDSVLLPVGYTFSRFVGGVYNDNNANFILFKQVDQRVVTESKDIELGTANSLTSIDLRAFVPVTAKEIIAQIRSNSSYIMIGSEPSRGVVKSSSYGLGARAPGTSNGGWDNAPFSLPITIPQKLYYFRAWENTPGAAMAYLSVVGWKY